MNKIEASQTIDGTEYVVRFISGASGVALGVSAWQHLYRANPGTEFDVNKVVIRNLGSLSLKEQCQYHARFGFDYAGRNPRYTRL